MKNNGFTLLEILIVVTIIGIVTTVSMPIFKPKIDTKIKELSEIESLINSVKEKAYERSENLILNINNEDQRYTIYNFFSKRENERPELPDIVDEGELSYVRNVELELYAPFIWMEPFDEGWSILINADGITPAMTFSSQDKRLVYNGSKQAPRWLGNTEDDNAF